MSRGACKCGNDMLMTINDGSTTTICTKCHYTWHICAVHHTHVEGKGKGFTKECSCGQGQGQSDMKMKQPETKHPTCSFLDKDWSSPFTS